MIQLTEEQQIVHDGVTKGDKRFSLLVGYAGTGKTTTVTSIVNTLLNPIREEGALWSSIPRITLAAPTHKAVAVMRKMAREAGYESKVNFSTVHSLLNLKPSVDDDTGEEKFTKSSFKFDQTLDVTDVLIVDEVSMIGNNPLDTKNPQSKGLFDELMQELRMRSRIKVLFVGDSYQIPPVGELDCQLFMPESLSLYGIQKYELTTVMRQALDSPILRYATELRLHKRRVDPPEELIIGKIGSTPESNKPLMEKIEKLIHETYCDPAYKNNTDMIKIVAWRNKTVNYFNLVTRQILYNRTDLPTLLVGEKIIADRPYETVDEDMIQNNTELDIVEIEPTIDKVPLQIGKMSDVIQIKIFKCTASEEDWISGGKIFHKILILDPLDQKLFDKTLDRLKKAVFAMPQADRKVGWNRFWLFRDRYMKFKYNYCITGHKSQGSTYEQAVVMDWDIAANDFDIRSRTEQNRIRYVAVTRPKNELHVVI